MKELFTTKRICRAGVIAALYATITMVLAPISYGEFQCRVSEALTILPLFFPEAIVGLTVGCLIANLLGNGVLDIVFGTLATLFASLVTYFIGRTVKNTAAKLVLGELPPILFNAIIVPFTFLALTELKELYVISALWVGLGQLAAIGILGTALYFGVERLAKKNVTLFRDAIAPEQKSSVGVANLLLTLGIVLPCVGSIFSFMFMESAVLAYILAAVALVVLVVAIVYHAVARKMISPLESEAKSEN